MQEERKSLFKCPQHPNRYCEAITYHLTSKQILVCLECVAEKNIPSSTLVYLDDIINCSDEKILKNWPPFGFNSPQIVKKLNEILVQYLDYSAALEQIIEQIFSEIERKLIDQLRESKEKVIKESIALPRHFAKILRTYHKAANIEELQHILEEGKSFERMGSSFKNIIERNLELTCDNCKKVEAVMNEGPLLYLALDEVDKKQKQLLEEIKQISIFKKEEFQLITTIKKKEEVKTISTQILDGKSSVDWGRTHLNQQLYPIFTKSNNCKEASCLVTNPILEMDGRYIIKCSLVSKSNMPCSVEIIPQNKCNEESLLYFTFKGYSSRVKIIKGNNIWDSYYYSKKGPSSAKEAEIEMRICVRNKYLLVLDYPDYENAILLSSTGTELTTQNHQIRLRLFGEDDNISIKEIKEVEEFPHLLEE